MGILQIIQISAVSCAIVNLTFSAINMIMIAWMGDRLGSFYEKRFHASLMTIVVVNVIIFSVVFTILMHTGAATTLP